MWTCPVCQEEIEDDSWETCWRCSSPQNLDDATIRERRLAVKAKIGMAVSLKCLRCQEPMEYVGTRRFRDEKSGLDGLITELIFMFGRSEQYDVYICPTCGKLEFFLDGLGDSSRGESVPPEPPEPPPDKRLDGIGG